MYERPRRQEAEIVRNRFLGCLLGGAVGDALGAPVEFHSRADIIQSFGPDGITHFAPAYGRPGAITDDTQMTLFTAEGLLRSQVRGARCGEADVDGVTAHAYLRWLETQGERPGIRLDAAEHQPGYLFGQTALHSRRAPGNTCLAALRAMRSLTDKADNDSKGCGAVMRMAPAGLFFWQATGDLDAAKTFETGVTLASVTHGHPSGMLTAGVIAVLILQLADGAALHDALSVATAVLGTYPDHEETLEALQLATRLATAQESPEVAIRQLGEGWVAEEALAIAVYCALKARDFREGVVWAVNHDGDSDSTGAITGNLLGALHGVDAIPPDWLAQLELRDVITTIAHDLYEHPSWFTGDRAHDGAFQQALREKYPGY